VHLSPLLLRHRAMAEFEDEINVKLLDRLVLWANIPRVLQNTILRDLDGIKGFRDRSNPPSFFSEYVANKYGVEINPDSLRATLSFFRKQTCSIGNAPNLTGFLHLKGDWAITNDWQIPFHDASLVDAMIYVATKVHNMKNLLICGDFWDNHMYSSFTKLTEGLTSEDQYVVSEEIMEMLLDHFDHIVWSSGNHEFRLMRMLEGNIKFERLGRMITSNDKVTLTPYPYVHINNSWRVTHPRNFSIIPLTVARKLAGKHSRNIICAHGHRLGVSFAESGRFIVADSGGLFDVTKMDYVMLTDSTHAMMNSGFMMLENNYPYVYGPFLTDWAKLGISFLKQPKWLTSLEGSADDINGSGHSQVDGMGGPGGSPAHSDGSDLV
jgi:hypothetical protein